jgi:hypothetical protein
MRLTEDHEGAGCEVDWLAHDLAGNVGFFASAGFGPVPEGGVLDDLHELMMALPVRSEVMSMNRTGAYDEDWLDVARRGLFAFDWNATAKLYVLLAAPRDALVLADLPEPLVAHVSARQLPTYFGRANQLDPALHR